MSAQGQPTDEALMLAYQRGEAGAFRTLAERHHGAIFRFCLRHLGGDRQAAFDATQEVFLRVTKNAKTWEQKAKVTTWLFTIARNHCIDAARKARFRRTDSLDAPRDDSDSGETRLDAVASDAPAADRLAHNARLRPLLDRALTALPEEQRSVFLLREVSGLSFVDIAAMFSTNENTIKSRMRYALAGLRKALEAEGIRDGASLAAPGTDR